VYDLVSLDAEVGRTREDRGTVLHEYLGAQDKELARVPQQQELADAMRVLDDREQRIVEYAYYEQRSQTEIAGLLGISQMHVSRIQRKAVAKMQAYLRGELQT